VKAPQIIIIVLLSINIVIALMKHGEPEIGGNYEEIFARGIQQL
jgi:hypothetical protein